MRNIKLLLALLWNYLIIAYASCVLWIISVFDWIMMRGKVEKIIEAPTDEEIL